MDNSPVGSLDKQTHLLHLELTDKESRYSTFDHEFLAAQAAIRYFRHFCEGYAFQLWKDPKLLVTALSRVSAPISPV
jgi:hypothetical protein